MRDVAVPLQSPALHHGHGLTIRAEIALDEAAPGHHAADVDVDIRVGTVPERLEQPICEGAYFQATREAYLLDVPGVARYLVRDGTTIEVSPTSPLPAVRLFLYGSPMAALLLQRGVRVLQGSAVRTRRGALLLLGPPASGKSVLAAAFDHAGYALLADDLCALALDPPRLLPGPRFLCLWEPDLASLGLCNGARRSRPGVDRFVVPMPIDDPEPVPLLAVCFLDSWNEERVRIDRVTGAARSALLLGSLYHRPFLEACFEPGEPLRRVSALAEVPCFRVWRPRTAWSLEPMLSHLCEALDL